MGQKRFRWPLKDDTVVYELQLTLYRRSATSNGCDEILYCGCDEILYCASACSCETKHVVVG